MLYIGDDDIANVTDFAIFVDFARQSVTARPVQIRRYRCYRNLNCSLLIFKALILLASVDAGMRSLAAAPSRPAIRPRLSARASSMISRSDRVSPTDLAV